MDHPRPGLKYVDADDLDNTSETFSFDNLAVVDPAGETLGEVDGFIVDVNSGRPFHVVVEAGHWYKHKHFLLPIGHVSLDAGSKRLRSDVAKDRAEKFPGFHRSEFEKLTDADMDRMAGSLASASSNRAVDSSTRWDNWKDYDYPSWWEASYYRPERIGNRDEAGLTGSQPQSTAADRRRS